MNNSVINNIEIDEIKNSSNNSIDNLENVNSSNQEEFSKIFNVINTNDNHIIDEMDFDTGENIDVNNNKIEILDDNKSKISDEKKEEQIEITDDMDIDELINDFSKFSEKEEKKKKQIELMLELFRLLGYHIYEQNDLLDIMIMREKLLEKKTNKLLLDKVPELKKVYNTGYLSCLHDNSIYKQKWPAINLLRQILKCNFYQLTPKILSNGYDKLSGKKQVTRVFVIEKILY